VCGWGVGKRQGAKKEEREACVLCCALPACLCVRPIAQASSHKSFIHAAIHPGALPILYNPVPHTFTRHTHTLTRHTHIHSHIHTYTHPHTHT